jgi:hypothetical protein
MIMEEYSSNRGIEAGMGEVSLIDGSIKIVG